MSDRILTGIAGEFLVAGELSKRGWIATLTAKTRMIAPGKGSTRRDAARACRSTRSPINRRKPRASPRDNYELPPAAKDRAAAITAVPSAGLPASRSTRAGARSSSSGLVPKNHDLAVTSPLPGYTGCCWTTASPRSTTQRGGADASSGS